MGLKDLLVRAVRRLASDGSDPVVELQTNFGGGKTHSMLALWHLFSGRPVAELPGIDAVMAEAKAGLPKQLRRVVLVGNKISPGQPVKKDDGTVVRTLWGELAWQLGGQESVDDHRIRFDDFGFRCVLAREETTPKDLKYGNAVAIFHIWFPGNVILADFGRP